MARIFFFCLEVVVAVSPSSEPPEIALNCDGGERERERGRGEEGGES